MKALLADPIRDAGYEALFLLAGYLSLAPYPSYQHAARVERWIQESRARLDNVRRLRKRGLLEDAPRKRGDLLRLTELGHHALAGGRHPDGAWNRDWDGKWRLLVFDLPQKAGRGRVQFWRWLRKNHFGRIQGSVWITPDPVEALENAMAEARLDPSMAMVFTGEPDKTNHPRDLAARAWDFSTVNNSYRQYLGFAKRVLHQIRGKAPSKARFRSILKDDRKSWWAAVRRDPLLPKALLPDGYQGIDAWKARQKMHHALCRAVESEVTR